MNTNTTLYTTGRNTQDVIDGFLGNMSAGQVAGDFNVHATAAALLNHCTDVDPSNYSTEPETVDEGERAEQFRTVPFTCSDIAARIVSMAREELQAA